MSDEEKDRARELGYPESTIQKLLRLRSEIEQEKNPKPKTAPFQVTGVDLPQACLDKLYAWIKRK